MTKILSARNLSKKYGKRLVVRDVSLEIKSGEVVGLLGPNGAGKTTCFYMMIGLVDVTSGHIFMDQIDMTMMPIYQRARLGMSYLPQEASIFRSMTVEDNIYSILEVVERSEVARKKKLETLLEEFSITKIRKSHALTLSGGERRRVEIARALACNPSFILLDEPFAGVDPIAINDIRTMVSHLKDRGIGVLITDHNVRETLSIVDRAYIIYDGAVLASGTRDEIVDHSDVRKLYLGEDFKF